MSNHSASYLLREVFILLEEEKFFESMGKEKTISFIKKVIRISQDIDCNSGEILEDIGERLKICHECIQYSEALKYGVCEKCRVHWRT